MCKTHTPCAKCVHGNLKEDGQVFCTYWVEYVNKFHSCTFHSPNTSEEIQMMNERRLNEYRELLKNNPLEYIFKDNTSNEVKRLMIRHKKFVRTQINRTNQLLTEIF